MEPVTKAKIKFCKFENALAMQVLYMDERFRAALIKEGFIIIPEKYINNINRVDVMSEAQSSLHTDCISLWGVNYHVDYIISSIKDNDIVGICDYIEALKDWAKNWEGWKDEPAIEPKITEYDGGVVMVEV